MKHPKDYEALYDARLASARSRSKRPAGASREHVTEPLACGGQRVGAGHAAAAITWAAASSSATETPPATYAELTLLRRVYRSPSPATISSHGDTNPFAGRGEVLKARRAVE